MGAQALLEGLFRLDRQRLGALRETARGHDTGPELYAALRSAGAFDDRFVAGEKDRLYRLGRSEASRARRTERVFTPPIARPASRLPYDKPLVCLLGCSTAEMAAAEDDEGR